MRVGVECAIDHRGRRVGALVQDASRDWHGHGVTRGSRMVAVGAATAGVAVSWLLTPIQQYAFDGLVGRRLPYVPDAWFGAYEAVYEQFGAPFALSQYYFWDASRC